MKTIPFYKMEATGNDFVVVDNRRKIVLNPAKFAREACDRCAGIGADGVLLIENSRAADFKMRIINADGSEAEMCGNGSRCAGLFARTVLKKPAKLSVETLAGMIRLEVKKNTVRAGLSAPRDFRDRFSLEVEGKTYPCYFINTGVPHTVLFVDGFDGFSPEFLGEKIRFHKEFAPKGTNVNFVRKDPGNSIYVRTYERGVGMTRACGTGVTASAIISAIASGYRSPVTVGTLGGELKVGFGLNETTVSEVTLEGKAVTVFKGEFFVNHK
ncbi:MAG TPA: diaminopimelate epimerase [Candidatus Omnitrophota bacterium]|nr:diaminopimelate epimerase [Candidatus Omnitrophota bacterium]